MGGGSVDEYDDDTGAIQTCLGVTKQGSPCKIRWDLDSFGYCKYHSPLGKQCLGIARSTGQRCRIKWGLNGLGYCKFHASSAKPRRCIAVARSTGERCRITSGIDDQGFCSVHQQATIQTLETERLRPRCKSVMFHTGVPCKNDAKPGYDYCCAAHDPSLPYFSPRLFDSPDKPRAMLEPQLIQLYDNRDLYHKDPLDLTVPGLIQLDHILEKQCFAYAFHGMEFTDPKSDTMYLAEVLRDEYVNDLSNMCLTRAATNQIKGSAVWKFLDDTITGHIGLTQSGLTSFTDYMIAERRDGTRLGRNTTRIISREMGRSLKSCQYKLAEEGETPLLDRLGGQLQDLFVRMDLYAPETEYSKLESAAKSQESGTSDAMTDPNERNTDSNAFHQALSASAKPFVPGQLQSTSSKPTQADDDSDKRSAGSRGKPSAKQKMNAHDRSTLSKDGISRPIDANQSEEAVSK
ncbi:hypothetical protein Poli38472_009984 [Pythium oligandrum]|uniref:Uncharacterized protein n=1 Tax=Pythium oligandrum TaxID=41045 RepID=A0A8K1FCK9_PYTOL|nr:hypothetical protein Poli38472_009984 [Pythium oligandrum]|eukprot:TMW58425.1 hypothetical protein Poli38472_009984 [Pythium oligandrum]